LIHTVESSPESLTAEHLAVFAARGIGRVSMGIQTLSDEVLARVNRQHGGSDALRACERLVASGLIVNIDLIYGLPGQTEAMFRHDFAAVAQCGVHSVTAYNLRVNERTSIVQTMGSDDQLSLARLVHWRAFVQATAAELGFVQKTWHTFQRPSDAARRYEDKTGAGNQLGVGLSARSRLGAVIYRNHASQPVYCDRIETGRSPVEETFQLAEEGRKIRFIAQSIGVGKPLEREPYRQAFGPSIDDDYGEALRRLGSVGLITDTGPAIELTPMGRLFYDLVTLAFYPRHIKDWLHARHTAAQARRAP
jgi:oxygen-independent coproporphyrinogen-3 oxidase